MSSNMYTYMGRAAAPNPDPHAFPRTEWPDVGYGVPPFPADGKQLLTSLSLLKEKTLRNKVCTGQDPFGMWPEGFTFRDLFVESWNIHPLKSFDHLPLLLKENPARFPYLVDKGCERAPTCETSAK